MRWLITGGCGFIGSSLLLRLISVGGQHIRIVDNLSVGTREDLAKICEYDEVSFGCLAWGDKPQLVVADVKDPEAAIRVASGANVIVHLAANTGVGPSVEDPRSDMLNNIIGIFNYLEAARANQVSRFVFASSGAPVGEVEPPIHEEIPPKPVSPYGASKLAGEGYCSAYYRTFGIETVTLRFGNVYGPGSVHKGSVVAKFIKKAMSGQSLEIYGDGSQTRDFIYIDDLIAAILLASSAPNVGGEIFQIATNRETTVGEMATVLVKVLSNAGLKQVRIINVERRLGDVERNYSDTTKAKHLLGWTAKIDLQDGLNRTVDYFIK